MCPMYLQSLKLLWPMVKEMHLQENALFDLDPKVNGVKVTQNVAQYSRQQSLMLLHPMVKKMMHLQETTLHELLLSALFIT